MLTQDIEKKQLFVPMKDSLSSMSCHLGLCNVPTTLQHLMNLIVAGLPWSSGLVSLDDIIITGKTVNLNKLCQSV